MCVFCLSSCPKGPERTGLRVSFTWMQNVVWKHDLSTTVGDLRKATRRIFEFFFFFLNKEMGTEEDRGEKF